MEINLNRHVHKSDDLTFSLLEFLIFNFQFKYDLVVFPEGFLLFDGPDVFIERNQQFQVRKITFC